MNECTITWSKDRIQNRLGVPFDKFFLWSSGADEFIAQLLRRTLSGQPTLACYLNAHTYNLSCRNESLRMILSHADILYPDGMSIVWAVRVLRGPRLKRMTGVDFFEKFLHAAQDAGARLYLLGGRPGVVDRAGIAMKERFPALQIVGMHPGQVDDETQIQAILADIKKCQPDLLLIGLGTPLQEQFAWTHGRSLGVPGIWTVGALFDYWAGVESAAPRCLGRMGLEWCWRLGADPKNKWRRYLVGNWIFGYRILRLMWKGRFFGGRS